MGVNMLRDISKDDLNKKKNRTAFIPNKVIQRTEWSMTCHTLYTNTHHGHLVIYIYIYNKLESDICNISINESVGRLMI